MFNFSTQNLPCKVLVGTSFVNEKMRPKKIKLTLVNFTQPPSLIFPSMPLLYMHPKLIQMVDSFIQAMYRKHRIGCSLIKNTSALTFM